MACIQQLMAALSNRGVNMLNKWEKQGYQFTDNKELMNIDIIHQFLSNESTWALGIPKSIVQKSIENSVCFAILYQDQLIAFARVITDKATFAHLVDVFVLARHRGKGLGRWLMEEILKSPDLKQLRRFTLTTSTANGLYKKLGFEAVEGSKKFMQILNSDIYSTEP